MQREAFRLWRRILYCTRGDHRDTMIMRAQLCVSDSKQGALRVTSWHSILWDCVDCRATWGLGHTRPREVFIPNRTRVNPAQPLPQA